MSSDEAAKSELGNLLGLMGTEAFDAQAKQRLSLFVNQSEQARRIYLDHCQMQAMLRQSSLLATFSAEAQADRVVLPTGSSVGSIVKWAALAAAACILFVAGLAMSSYFREVTHSNAVTIRSAVAIVEGIDGIAWAENTALIEGAEVSQGGIRIDSGSVRIRFIHGTMLLVEGPAEIAIDSDMQVSLKHGRVAARVSEDAHGFTILGPNSAVVDLGTEFAMAVEGGESWVEVYDGEVDIALLDEGGRAWKSRQLTTSDAVWIDVSGGKIIDGVPPIELPRFAGPSLEGLDVPVAYIDAVRESSPAHYWRFEQATDNQVVDAVGDATAVLADGARLHNGSLYFPRGRRNHGFAFVEEPIPALLNDEFTMEVWAKASFPQRSTLIDVNHREPDSKFREKLYRIAFLPSLETIYPGDTVRFIGQLWPYGEQEAVSAFSADRYRPGSWHHLVAVRRTDRLELYFDGKPANAVPAPRLTPDPLPTTITMGRFSGPHQPGSKPDRAHFKGLVDEVAIYASALSADEVAEHYRLMQVK